MSLKEIRAFGNVFDLEITRKDQKIKIEVIVDNKLILEKTIKENDQVLVELTPKR